MVTEASRIHTHWVEDYKNQPVVTTQTTLYAFDGIEMREVNRPTSKHYAIVWDGTVISKCDTTKEATTMFLDFTGLTKGKLNKYAVKATA